MWTKWVGILGGGAGGGEHNIAFNPSDLPDNPCLDGLSEGMTKAWELYEQPR